MAVSTRVVGHTGSVVQTHYLYTPELNLMAEATAVDGQTTIDYEYLWFGGQPVAQFETSTGAVHYYFNDHLGAPILTTDATGAVDWRVEREPYGRIVEVRAGAGRHQPLSLPGQEQRAAEASYNILRWYRAGWGRYMEADPISAELNDFAYAELNPLRKIDPVGLVTVQYSGVNYYGMTWDELVMNLGGKKPFGITLPSGGATCNCSCKEGGYKASIYIGLGIDVLYANDLTSPTPEQIVYEEMKHVTHAETTLKNFVKIAENIESMKCKYQWLCKAECVNFEMSFYLALWMDPTHKVDPHPK